MSGITIRVQDIANRLRHWRLMRAALKGPRPENFTSYPEPIGAGNYAQGMRLLSGDLLYEDKIVSTPGEDIWDIFPSSVLFLERLHAMDFMDDLAAVNTEEAHRRMREWGMGWIQRFGHGEEIRWRADIVGWRVIRLITYATILLNNAGEKNTARFFESLGIQTNYLRLCAYNAPKGLPRFVALSGWLFGAIAFEGFEDDLESIVDTLDYEAELLTYGGEAGLTSRDPSELSEIFCLLVWCDNALKEAGWEIGDYHIAAIQILGRALRRLRMGDRNLVKCHGGGAGNKSAIDRALATSQVQGAARRQIVLGFTIIRADTLHAIIDSASPPEGKDHQGAHASTLALWVSDGDKMLIGSQGWSLRKTLSHRLRCQETQATSALVLGGESSSVLVPPNTLSGEAARGATIERAARIIDYSYEESQELTSLSASHDGYRARFGLVHNRKIKFDRDGCFFAGVDLMEPVNAQDEKKVLARIGRNRSGGIPLAIWFHLAPEIEPSIDLDGKAISFSAPSGRLWVFRQQGGNAEITDSQYYEEDRLHPIPTKSIVVHSQIVEKSGYISWSFQAYD